MGLTGENHLCKTTFRTKKMIITLQNDNHTAILRIKIPHVPLLPLKKLIFQMQTIAYPCYLPILKMWH